jgi:hypothetical protein
MPNSKLTGPCSVENCVQDTNRFRRITPYAWEKASMHGILKQYPYLELGHQLCYHHYLAIIEPDRNESKETPIPDTSSENFGNPFVLMLIMAIIGVFLQCKCF